MTWFADVNPQYFKLGLSDSTEFLVWNLWSQRHLNAERIRKSEFVSKNSFLSQFNGSTPGSSKEISLGNNDPINMNCIKTELTIQDKLTA